MITSILRRVSAGILNLGPVRSERSVVIILAVLSMAALTGTAGGETPARFQFQASLRDSGGLPLSGTHPFTFSLYQGGSANQAHSGLQVYSETATVTVEQGIVNHTVGAGTVIAGALSAATLRTSAPLFLQVAVDAPSNVILPRTRVEPVPYATLADSAAHATASDNGVPAGFMILSPAAAAPAGYAATGMAVTATTPAWMPRAPMLSNPLFAASAVADGTLFVFGGMESSGLVVNTTLAYNPAADTWTTRTPMLTGRALAMAAAVGGKIYVLGGVPDMNGDVISNLNEVYDPVTDAWETTAPMPMGVFHAAAAVVSGRIHVVGGKSHPNTMVSDNQEFDPVAASWRSRAPLTLPRFAHAAATHGGRIHIVGGGVFASATPDHLAYDPAANSWSNRADLPGPRRECVLLTFQGKLHAIGGSDNNSVVLDQNTIYDADTNSWSQGLPLPQVRSMHHGGVVGSELVITGGYHSDESPNPDPITISYRSELLYLFRKQ